MGFILCFFSLMLCMTLLGVAVILAPNKAYPKLLIPPWMGLAALMVGLAGAVPAVIAIFEGAY